MFDFSKIRVPRTSQNTWAQKSSIRTLTSLTVGVRVRANQHQWFVKLSIKLFHSAAFLVLRNYFVFLLPSYTGGDSSNQHSRSTAKKQKNCKYSDTTTALAVTTPDPVWKSSIQRVPVNYSQNKCLPRLTLPTQLNDKYGGDVWATVERIVLQFRLQVSLLGGISRSSSGNGRGEE